MVYISHDNPRLSHLVPHFSRLRQSCTPREAFPPRARWTLCAGSWAPGWIRSTTRWPSEKRTSHLVKFIPLVERDGEWWLLMVDCSWWKLMITWWMCLNYFKHSGLWEAIFHWIVLGLEIDDLIVENHLDGLWEAIFSSIFKVIDGWSLYIAVVSYTIHGYNMLWPMVNSKVILTIVKTN